MSDLGDDVRTHLIVLFGGQSAEHDISCTTAAHVIWACDQSRYRVTPIGISRDGQWAIANANLEALDHRRADPPHRLDPTGTPVDASAVLAQTRDAETTTVVLPLLHGPMGEDGTVQGLLELCGLPYVGSGVLGSALGMDKAMAKHVLSARGIAQARHRSLHESDVHAGTPAELADTLGLPLFVKPANMGSSVGVTKAHDLDEVRDALDIALSYDEWVVVEEAITGREIEVAVLGNVEPRASVPGEIVPGKEFYDYADKYIDDGATLLVPAALDEAEAAEVRRLAVAVFSALRCEGLARVDFFYETAGPSRGFLCNEVNTMPGFTPISMYPKLWQATGLSYGELIDELVRLALERHGRRRHNTKP